MNHTNRKVDEGIKVENVCVQQMRPISMYGVREVPYYDWGGRNISSLRKKARKHTPETFIVSESNEKAKQPKQAGDRPTNKLTIQIKSAPINETKKQ